MTEPDDFFNLSDFKHRDLWQKGDQVWDALKRLHTYLEELISIDATNIQGKVSSKAHIHGGGIYIGRGTIVEDGAYISGPTFISEGCIIRHGAYVRGDVIVGNGSIIGHSSEIKHSILLNESKAPHFAYVGDSILGHRVNLGAGTKLSNLTIHSAEKSNTEKRLTIHIPVAGQNYNTGLTKLGAILGDDVQTGCNCVTNPGCLVGPRTLIYANTSLRKGFTPSDSLVKLSQEIKVDTKY